MQKNGQQILVILVMEQSFLLKSMLLAHNQHKLKALQNNGHYGGSGFDSNTAVSGSNYSAKYWALQAAASKTEFSNIYHGNATSDPSADPDGSALEAGDLYFNSSSNVLRVYNGSSWQDAAVDTTSFAGQGFAVAMAIAL